MRLIDTTITWIALAQPNDTKFGHVYKLVDSNTNSNDQKGQTISYAETNHLAKEIWKDKYRIKKCSNLVNSYIIAELEMKLEISIKLFWFQLP